MRIVIIEDNQTLANAIAYRLRDKGHAADVLHDGDEAHAFLKSEGADLIVLDINLPGRSGLDIVRALRQRQDSTPVLLLTSLNETQDRVAGLDAGADDYLAKPFDMAELEARIRALSRRRQLEFGETQTVGAIQFNRSSRQVTVDGRILDIPRRELAVLECLIERRGRLVPKSQLIDHVYGVGANVEDSAIEPHVSRLRRRVSDYQIGIKTARGLGYMLTTDE